MTSDTIVIPCGFVAPSSQRLNIYSSFTLITFLFTVALLLFGCGAPTAAPSLDDGTTENGPESASDSYGAESIRFDPPGTLESEPREAHDLRVVVSPAARYPVRFAILAGEGDARPNDATLDRSEVTTDEDGVAEVRLVAPSNSTTFNLRASVGTEVSAVLTVSVSDIGHDTLTVIPEYAGERVVHEWVASVRAGTSCEDLGGMNIADGELVGRDPVAPEIDNVPIGPTLAVTLRAGYYVTGCADVQGLEVGGDNQAVVPTTDRPLKMSDVNLDLSLDVTEQTSQWLGVLLQTKDEILSMLFSGSDAETILDSMQESIADETGRLEFATNREQFGFDAELLAAYGSEDNQALESTLSDWLEQAATKMDGPEAFLANLTSAGFAEGQAAVTLFEVAHSTPERTGFPTDVQATWTADPGDIVLLGASIYWRPSKLLMELAQAVALEQTSSDESIVDAMAQTLDCGRVGDVVAGATESGTSFADCDAACTRELCLAALGNLWYGGGEVLSEEELHLSATGKAEFDDYARPTGFAGNWVATLQDGDLSVLRGEVTATDSSQN